MSEAMVRYKVKIGEEFEVEVKIDPDDDPSGEAESESTEPKQKPAGTGKSRWNSSPEGVLDRYDKIQRGRISEREATVRVFLTFSILVVVIFALLLALVYGWQKNNFGAVQQVWNVGSVFVSSVTTYYFVKKDADRNKKDESSD